MPSSKAAVASSFCRSQRAMSPAPTSTCAPTGAVTVTTCEVVAVAPSPKFQLQATTLPSGSVLVLVKLQLRSPHALVNDAVGGRFGAVTVTDCEVEPVAPLLSVTVRLTV